MKRILIACEASGVVREAFKLAGWDAWSCDLNPTLIEGKHFQTDVRNVLNMGWDMMIAHPPCTNLAVSGAAWFKYKQDEQKRDLAFVQTLMDAPIPRIAVENPVSIISSRIRKPDQIVQPYMFGHPERKTTCLWLKNLPKLIETDNVKDQVAAGRKGNPLDMLPPSADRGFLRSITYQGFANAMAAQWGILD